MVSIEPSTQVIFNKWHSNSADDGDNDDGGDHDGGDDGG